ncbi:MAG: hypothetical protein NC219_08915 [Prevotella sp.]|nr:hypothetical protein [Prevotella sp.]
MPYNDVYFFSTDVCKEAEFLKKYADLFETGEYIISDFDGISGSLKEYMAFQLTGETLRIITYSVKYSDNGENPNKFVITAKKD